MFAYRHFFSEFPEKFKEIICLILCVCFEYYLFIEHNDFSSLFILVDYRKLIRDIKRGKVKFKRLKSSDISISFEKVCTMFFDDSPIEKIDNLFFSIVTIRIFDEKDVFFKIFEISSNFKVVNDLIHFLYRKILSKRRLEE